METASAVAQVAVEFVAVWLLVDFVSGVVHWAEDSYGRETTPVIGRWVVTPNVLHHRAGTAFVGKSWLASSWDLAAAGAAIVAAAALAGMLTWHVVLFAVLGANANQIHKWNHVRRSQVPLAVRVLQRLHLVQSVRHHARHHRGAKDSHYCVITEALNPVLDRLGCWRLLEKLLAPVLGRPRSFQGARPLRVAQQQSESEAASAPTSMRDRGSTSAFLAMVACNVILLVMLSACSRPAQARESFVQVSAGGWPGGHTCGVTTSGGLKCWGGNLYGQLGDGTKVDRLVPVDVVGLAAGVKAVSAGGRTTCALMQAGHVKCWGFNGYGQLGDGSRVDSAVPRDVHSLGGVLAIDAGGDHNCALTGDGQVHCWGYVTTEQECPRPSFLGVVVCRSVTIDRLEPTEVPGLGNARQVSASSATPSRIIPGFGPTVCGVDAEGAVRCTERFDGDARAVPGHERDTLSVSAGAYHACALASSGDVDCWGNSGGGREGPSRGTTQPSGLEKGVASIAAGWDFTCAVTAQGRAKCWGRGGALGDGTTVDRSSPVEVSALRGVVSVAAASAHACALLADGQTYCWGDNSGGQLGDGTRVDRMAPVGVLGFSEFVAPPVPANYQGLWWKSPAGSESGWGLNIAHQGDVLFATWFTYDTDGRGMWLAMPNGSRLAEGVYAGALYRTTGPAFDAQPWGRVQALQIGVATLTFSDGNSGTFTYTVDGVTQSKPITRQVFSSPVPDCVAGGHSGPAPNYQDLWWHGPPVTEPGWGISITHQGDLIFATWFTYDATGKGQWLVMPRGAKFVTNGYSGTLYRTTGPAFNASPWDSTRVKAVPVGEATFSFVDSKSGYFIYRLDGVTQTRYITRQVFSTPTTVCG